MPIDFMSFIHPELLVLIPVLNIVGMVWKKSNLEDRFIPLVLVVVGILLSGIWVLGMCHAGEIQTVAAGLFTAVVQGILCAGVAVLGHQIVKQTHNKE